ncbi:uncharacterized protein [Canis lupus baileyi]|uniref:uncharacterized protein LOC112652933 isoform X3 n=1 Tax=Canis lupus dingo TaxID=286419 RepID=UPI0015F193A0|nr:uncharacterized protein LOC112652933 isoform X3 [Canis lupus dingo]XP_038531856.1 uncharacterized protein LOC106559243 isoform X2 [Canis lupus familiaris]
MRVEVNDKECLKLQKLLPVDDNKKVFQNRLLSALKSFKGGKIDVNNLNTLLGNMGIKLKNKEFKSVVQNQPMDAVGNVSLKKVVSDVTAVTDYGNVYKNRLLDDVKSFKGRKVDVSNLEDALENMKIKFPDKKLKDLSQNLPTDADGMVKKNTLLDYIKAFPGGKCRTSKIASWKTWVMSWRVRKLRTCRTNCRLMVKRLN